LLLFPQRYCQGHGAAKAVSRGDQLTLRLAAAVLCCAAGWTPMVEGMAADGGSAARVNSCSGFEQRC